jgi:hypothetical protein
VKPFPLGTLLRVREHREQRALQVVNEDKARLGAALAAMQAVRARLGAIEQEERNLTERLTSNKGQCGATALAGIDARRALLRDKKAATLEELARANEVVEQARRALAKSIHAYRQMRAMKDSAVVQRDRWEVQERHLSERRDEIVAEDYVASRYTFREP